MVSDHKVREAVLAVGPDGKVRAFTRTGICLGVVVTEHDTIDDGLGFFRGLIFSLTLLVCLVLVTWVGFKAVAWIYGVSP